MKTILALAIIMLAINQVLTCDGYKSGKSCLYTGAIPHCKVYDAPKGIDTATTHSIICQTCEEFWEVDADGDCSPKLASIALNGLYYMSTAADYAKLIDVVDYRGLTLDYTKLSCVITGQIVPYCAPAYYYNTADFKCTSCTATNCDSCDATTPAKCLDCAAGHLLQADGTCKSCGTGALTCLDDTKHVDCLSGYFLKDQVCTTCGSVNALTCVSATEHKTCAVGFKLDATTKLCVTCGDNVGSCTASSITFCSNSSDSAKYNYITAADDACVGHAITNNCLTIEGTTAPYKCASCITNYIMSNGVCKHWSNWVDGGAVAANKSVATITPGTSAAAVTTITCQSTGWYKDTAAVKCIKCFTGCATCSDTALSTAALTDCLTADTTVNTMYMSSATPAVPTACATGIATCSSATTILTCAATHAFQVVYAGTTANVYDGATTTTCETLAANIGGITGAHCAIAHHNTASTVSKKCLQCISDKALQNSYAATIGTGTNTQTCETLSVTSSEEKYGCTKYNIVSTTASTILCTACSSTHYFNSTTSRCIKSTNCSQMSQTENKCTTCSSGTLVNGACVTTIANCKTYNSTTVTNCDECDAGYAWSSATVKTTCTDPTITNCEFKNPLMKTLKDCLICKMGYQWDAATMTCKGCTEEGVKCVSTGCESFAASGSTTTPPAANSTVIVFIFTTLVALMSLLI